MLQVKRGAVTPGVAAPGRVNRSGLRRMIDVVVALTRADVRARYGRGHLRLVKWLLDPYALLGVYLLLVTFAIDRPGRAPGLSLACAIIPFQLVTTSIAGSTTAVTMRESIILNMRFDRLLIPVATVATETVAFLASLTMIALTMIAYDVGPTPAIAWYPLVFAVNVLLALALAYPVTLIGLWFRELRVFVISFARAMFFLSPSIVPLAETSEHAQRILRFNPLTGLFEAHRAVFLYGRTPRAIDLLYPALFALALLILVTPIYRSEERQFAKVVE